MKLTSFSINGRAVSRLSINGREVSLKQEPVFCDALCFTAEEPGSTVKLSRVGSAPAVNLQTSINGRTWTPYTVGNTITLANVDDKVYFKAVGSNSVMGSSTSNYNKFVMTGKIAASGNVNSVLEEDEEIARTMSLAGKNFCYYRMFDSCTSLTQAPELPATTVADRCYTYMFNGCTSLTKAPELPATTLDSYCYANMFRDCTSLTQAPALPAETLTDSCYSRIFFGCTSLTQAPELPSTTLANNCYQYMFSGCTKLNYVKVAFTNWTPSGATSNWLPDNAGTFECPQELIDNTTSRTTSTVPTNWNMKAYDAEPECLCFTAEEPGSTIKLSTGWAGAPEVNLQTSFDGKNWTPHTVGSTITLADVGDKVYFKAIGSNERMASSNSAYNKFVMTGKIAASGNVNSLLEEDEETARTMSLAGKVWCYVFMFSGCTSLTQAPELPATTLAGYCYYEMFRNCSSLTQAPELPATTLAEDCYANMFQGCRSLTQVLEELPARTLTDDCYFQMFKDCSSLEQAPGLPATTLATRCYSYMFQNCTNLNYVKVAFTNWTKNTTNGWLPNNVGTFECPWDLITNTSTRSGDTVPSSWTMVAV